MLTTIVAYASGLLPAHYVRAVDRHVFHANNRNDDSKWSGVLATAMLSLSDQQLVTGLAILIAGFYGMFNDWLDIYHWTIVVYLAWLSSAVHIASLTLLRDVFVQNTVLRNSRVAGMLLLLALLLVALWPLRYNPDVGDPTMPYSAAPARCLWTTHPHSSGPSSYLWNDNLGHIDPNWKLTVIMLCGAYVWKLGYLYSYTRGWVRNWTVDRPEAALESAMRYVLLADWTTWLKWPAFKGLLLLYFWLVLLVETIDSFMATIIYLFLALIYGVAVIVSTRANLSVTTRVSDEVLAGEATLTFGQLVPLFLLILPALGVFELSVGSFTWYTICRPESQTDLALARRTEPNSAIYRLMSHGLHRSPPCTLYQNMSSALRQNPPSPLSSEMPSDSSNPILDHMMRSRAFKFMVLISFGVVVGLGLGVTIPILIPGGNSSYRWLILTTIIPFMVAAWAGTTIAALLCSKRLR